VHRFWSTPEAEFIRFHRRRGESLRITLPLEPPTKKTRRRTKEKAREALSAAFEADALARRARELTKWPKPRAEIALDILLFSSNRNGARVDNICKWLLDELIDHVYADDRQVKLLYARAARLPASRPQTKKEATQELASEDVATLTAPEDFDVAVPWLEPVEPAKDEPKLYITAQTRANVLADLRAVSDLDERWDPFEEEHGIHHRKFIEHDTMLDHLIDYRSIFDPDNDDGLFQRRLITKQIDYQDQSQQQHVVDMVFSSLLTDLPVDRFGVWNQVRSHLQYTPYLFDLGVLPTHGGSLDFQARLRELLLSRRERFPGLFPMRARSGVSMILFEEQRSGKDLDNLIRTVLPDVLEILRPQQHDLPGWIAEEVDPAEGVTDIPFIEVAAYPAHMTDMPPGSVVFGLSSAGRYSSWWDRATAHLERTLDETS